MTCRLTSFKAEHLLAIDYAEPMALDEQQLLSLGRTHEQGLAFSAECDGRILGAAGIYRTSRQRAAVWAAFSHELLRDHALWMHRHIRHVLDDTIRVLELRRVKAMVLHSQPHYCRWIERLGFTPCLVAGEFIVYVREL